MDTLVFPSEEALRVALTAGLIPPEVQRAAVGVERLPDGSVALAPSAPLPPQLKKGLKELGVREGKGALSAERLAPCWAAAVRPTRTDLPLGVPPLTLFALAHREGLLALCGELLRLGCDRQELRSLQGLPGLEALVRVRETPWYTLERALERPDALRAFLPVPGREGVFLELGFTHPLASALSGGGEGLLLIGGDGALQVVPTGTWVDVDQRLDALGLPSPQALVPGALPRLPVRLRLERSGRAEEPSLWVAPQGLAAVEQLVRATPEAALEGLLFAVSGSTVVLRSRPGRERFSGALPGEAYQRLLELPNLYVPVGQGIEPPLRRDRLRTWLSPDSAVVTWLVPGPSGGFSTQSLSDDAFQPLTEWVDYVLDAAAPELSAWVRSTTFDCPPHQRAEAAYERQPRAPRPSRPEAEARRAPPAPRRQSPPAAPVQAPAARTPSGERPLVAAVSLTAAEEALAQEEAAFLALDAAPDSPQRREAWTRLAGLYAASNRPRELGLAFAYALWDAPEGEAAPLARQWAQASGTGVSAVLEASVPSVDQTRALAAHLVAAATEGLAPPAPLPRLVEWFDKHDDALDVRSFWLSRVALATLSGGDALLVARARDRVLVRLQRGLSLDRDVPRLLRVSNSSAGRDNERVARVAAQLEAILKSFDDVSRKRTPLEAPWPFTRPYVQFEFAWGFARLGLSDRARALRDAGATAIDGRDAVHQFLRRAFVARIDQALEGLSPELPLPPEVTNALGSLTRDGRYHLDRVRQSSSVLEQQRLSASDEFVRSLNRSGEDLALLNGITDVAELARNIEQRVQVAADAALAAEERERLLNGLLDLLVRLPEAAAVPLLNQLLAVSEALPPEHRVGPLGDALRVAGHFGRPHLVRQLMLSFGNLLTEVGAKGADKLGATLATTVRALRKVGLRDEGRELLARGARVFRGDDVPAVCGRLAVAGGFASLGAMDQANPIFEEVLARLARDNERDYDRIVIHRAASRALGYADTETALRGLLRLAAQLPRITDSFSTNQYLSTSLVSFADALVLGHVGDDLVLNEVTRRYLEEDEFLVRRRVHHDSQGSA